MHTPIAELRTAATQVNCHSAVIEIQGGLGCPQASYHSQGWHFAVYTVQYWQHNFSG